MREKDGGGLGGGEGRWGRVGAGWWRRGGGGRFADMAGWEMSG
jgi:hypothetical protein